MNPESTKARRSAMEITTETELRRHLFVWHPNLYRLMRTDAHRPTAEAHYDLHAAGKSEFIHGHKH